MKTTALLGCGATALALVAIAGPVGADETCGAEARAWAAACSAAGGGRVEALRCPADHVILSVAHADGEPTLLDVTRGPSGVRQVRGLGLSPIGDFADLRTAPQAVRDGLARVGGCIEREPSVPFPAHYGGTTNPRAVGAPPLWRVLNALLAVLVVSSLELARRRRARRRLEARRSAPRSVATPR